MRCEEIQKRLTEGFGRTSDLNQLLDEFREHLSQCEACSRVAESSLKLSQLFQAVAHEPETDLMPLETRMRLVAREAESSGWFGRLGGFVGRLVDAVSFGHRRLALSSSLVALILSFVTLVPFGYDRVVGYNLTISGICPEVADDHEIVRALLYERGVEQAVIDVTECDTTCSLIVFDLRSEREIELAMATYEELGAEATIENIAVITDRGSRSLLRMAKERIFSN